MLVFADPTVDGLLYEPTRLTIFDGHIITQVAIGLNHSLFLTTVGVYSAGSNENGQLGHNKRQSTPGNL